MSYKYSEQLNANIEKLSNYGLNERFVHAFANELTYAQVVKADAQTKEAHGRTEEAKEDYETVKYRITFLLGMVDTLRALQVIEYESDTNRALCDMALSLR